MSLDVRLPPLSSSHASIVEVAGSLISAAQWVSRMLSTVSKLSGGPAVSTCRVVSSTGTRRAYVTSGADEENPQPGIRSLALPTVVPLVTRVVIALVGRALRHRTPRSYRSLPRSHSRPGSRWSCRYHH